jgi:thiamine-monophosphate kinase
VRPGPLSTPGSPTVADLGERRVIADIRARLPAPPPWLHVGVGDDGAVAEPARGALEVLTTDGLVEGVHFDRRFSSAGDVGWKALAVNVSDIAAMGGTPRLALLSLALPRHLPASDFHALVDGFLALARECGVTLAGGNITESPGPLMLDVTLIGTVRPRRILRRSGARPGDELYVTGSPGAAAAGLGWLRTAATPAGLPDDPELARCVTRYRRPEPRARVGALLGRNRAASAGIDLSDGLADSVRQIAEASGVGVLIDAAALPIPAAARTWFDQRGMDAVTATLAGGDDYELLFTVPRRTRGRLVTVRRQSRGVPLTRIGEITKEPEVRLLRNQSTEQLPAGFVHF